MQGTLPYHNGGEDEEKITTMVVPSNSAVSPAFLGELAPRCRGCDVDLIASCVELAGSVDNDNLHGHRSCSEHVELSHDLCLGCCYRTQTSFT